MTLPEIFDTHTHLDAAEFDNDRAEVLVRATEAGVMRIVNIGATDGFLGAERSLKLAEENEQIWFSAGIHPHDAETPLDKERLRKFLNHPRCVAVGETGLDFFKDWSPRDLQYKWFRLQVELALEAEKPLVIHSRDSLEECLEVLIEMNAQEVGGVFHCYAGDAKFAKRLESINFLVSFPGILTFPKAENVREAARDIPIEQIMLETDAPYLAPVPFRGKRCESSYTVETARKLAELKGMSYEEIACATTRNALSFYKIK